MKYCKTLSYSIIFALHGNMFSFQEKSAVKIFLVGIKVL